MKTTCGPLSAMFPKKYQAPLASLIVDQVHHTEVAQMLSDVAKNLAEKTDPKKAFETMLGERVRPHSFSRFASPTGHCCISNCSQRFQTKAGRRC